LTFAVKELPNAAHPNHSVPRDGLGRPMIVPKGGGRPVPHTRVTTYIDCIEDKSTLAAWKLRTALLGLAEKPSLLDAVRDVKDPDSPTGKRKLNGLVERALEIGGANRASKKGTDLHTLSELVDQRLPLPRGVSEADMADIVAYMVETSCLRMTAIEQFVVVAELAVAGTFDRTAIYAGECPAGAGCPGLHITDLKTGTLDYGKIKMPSQLATYSRGEVYDFTRFPAPSRDDKKAWETWKKTSFSAEEAAEAYSPLPPICQDWGIIIHLPQGAAECTLYWADLTAGWDLARFAGEVRGRRSVKGTLKKFSQGVHTSGSV
jgi:hypothetical protein